MDSTIVMGHAAKVKVNENAFAVRRGRVRITMDEHETGDTESGQYKRQKSGRVQLEAELECYEDTAVKLHAAPLNITDVQGEIDLKVYPKGVGFEPYHCPKFVLTSFEYSNDVNNPASFSLSGKSDGVFLMPTD
jgi:hypothetical protein